ncbi:Afadin [Thelohanellus kitauei]|uniref:Afadin n=1 Tax=Thelohanellus kitauei TaxID=669202 RepID=A0A0C2MJY5_THEKT|nr:Afadin [Thelohanellus kitauei]
MKVFTGSVFPESQYKTIIASIYDSTRNVIKEVLAKLTSSKNELKDTDYFLSVLLTPKVHQKKLIKQKKSEYRILDDDYPLLIQNKLSKDNAAISFHLRKYINLQQPNNQSGFKQVNQTRHKYFAVLYGMDIPHQVKPRDHPETITLNRDMIVFGSNTFSMKTAEFHGHKPTQLCVLNSETIHPLHCVVSALNGVLTITPAVIDADVRVNDIQIFETTILNDGYSVSIGCVYFFQVSIPSKVSANMSQIYWKTYMHQLEPPPPPTIENQNLFVRRKNDTLLPLYLKFDKGHFEDIIEKFVKMLSDTTVTFKQSSSYLIYLAFITQLDNYLDEVERPNDTNSSKNPDFRSFCKICYKILTDLNALRICDPNTILLWLNNMSEFLHFLRQDVQLSSITDDVQKFCEHCIRISINEITRKFENDFIYLIDSFFKPLIEANNAYQQLDTLINYDPSTDSDFIKNQMRDKKRVSYHQRLSDANSCDITDILRFFNRWMSRFCFYHINVSFTVQICQRMFASICKNLIDKIIMGETPAHKHYDLVDALRVNYNLLQIWSESQGLEMIVNKCMAPYIKIVEFLESDLSTIESFLTSVEKLDFLNSKQLESLLNLLPDMVSPAKMIANNFQKTLKQVKRVALENLIDKEIANNVDINSLRLEYQSQIIKPCFISPDGYSSENPQEVSNILYKAIKNLEISGMINLSTRYTNIEISRKSFPLELSF